MIKKYYINGRFLEYPITGVQRYSMMLTSTLDQLLSSGELDSSTTETTCLIPKRTERKPNWTWIRSERIGRFSGNLWEQIELPLYVSDGTLFSPANVGPFFVSGQAITIHDASVFAVPEAYSFAFRLKYKLLLKHLGKTSKIIITDSHFSKSELVKYCQIDPQKIEVVYPGHEHILSIQPDENILDQYSLRDKGFLLFVGSQSQHKNLQTLLSALKLINNQDLILVIAGGKYEKVFKDQQNEMPANVIDIAYITDPELCALYKNAKALIFPSKYEGFGFPVLEALAMNCPVICSNSASLPEVGGDFAHYFDPMKPAQLAELINETPQQKKDYALQSHLQNFSWENCAQKVWNLLTEQ